MKLKNRRFIKYAGVGILLACAAVWLIHNMNKNENTAAIDSETQFIADTEMPLEYTEDTEISDSEKNTELPTDEAKLPAMAESQNEYQRILNLSAGEQAVYGLVSDEILAQLFYSMEIDDSLFAKINGISYTPNTYIDISELRYLRMLCYGLDGNTYVGEMIVNEKIADTVLEIFQKLYENQYPIERMVLVDNYQANDELSMADNNTSAFNFRQIAGSDKLSNHSYGMAIDINPKYNPYVKTAADGSILCQPESGRDYIDRTKDFPYKIDENDLAYLLFTEAGFTWGGNWNSVKDYQHFEMEFEN